MKVKFTSKKYDESVSGLLTVANALSQNDEEFAEKFLTPKRLRKCCIDGSKFYYQINKWLKQDNFPYNLHIIYKNLFCIQTSPLPTSSLTHTNDDKFILLFEVNNIKNRTNGSALICGLSDKYGNVEIIDPSCEESYIITWDNIIKGEEFHQITGISAFCYAVNTNKFLFTK